MCPPRLPAHRARARARAHPSNPCGRAVVARAHARLGGAAQQPERESPSACEFLPPQPPPSTPHAPRLAAVLPALFAVDAGPDRRVRAAPHHQLRAHQAAVAEISPPEDATRALHGGARSPFPDGNPLQRTHTHTHTHTPPPLTWRGTRSPCYFCAELRTTVTASAVALPTHRPASILPCFCLASSAYSWGRMRQTTPAEYATALLTSSWAQHCECAGAGCVVVARGVVGVWVGLGAGGTT